MTIKEVQSIQLGDEIELPTGEVVKVSVMNHNERLIGFTMSGGSKARTLFPSGELPDEKRNQPTKVICEWGDILAAVKKS